jgi:Arc/MetJ-type ribon-helix-helix transcriptional regulator
VDNLGSQVSGGVGSSRRRLIKGGLINNREFIENNCGFIYNIFIFIVNNYTNMTNKTLNISMPIGMAQYIEQEVNNGQFASTSDFFRHLVREYQAKAAERWADRLIEQRRATAQDPTNLIGQDDFEREILGHNVNEATN